MKCLTHNLEVNYPCSPACPLFGDCVVAFQNEQKKRVQTNADRIRAMSDEELSLELMTWRFETAAKYHGVESVYPNTQKTILDWLRQPVKEDD